MKKLISAMLVVMMAFTFPMQTFAENSPTLESIANNIIEITTDNSDENPTTTYNNIEKFVNEVHNQIPDIDDLQLANFIVDYTGQEEFNIEDEEALKYLGFKEITVTEDYIKVDEAGNIESMTQDEMTLAMFRDEYGVSPQANPSTSNNGYMKMKHVISRETGVLSNNKVGYQIAVFAHWLKMPLCHFEDVLALYFSSGSYDSNHEVYGKLEETIACCASTYKYKTQVWKTANKPDYHTNKNVTVDNIVGNAQGIRFKLRSAAIYLCPRTVTANNHMRTVTDILTYISYGIRVTSKDDCVIQAVYGHKTISLGSIGVSASADGVSLSLSPKYALDEYRADKLLFTAI